MNAHVSYYTRTFTALLAAIFLAGCATISTFDQAAYANTIAAKVEALALMTEATGDYSSHTREIAAVVKQVDKAYEYDRGRPLNQITVKQWEILLSPERNLFGGFLRDWQRKGSFKPVALAERKKLVSEAFDQIIGLESGKLKPSEIPN